MLECNAVLFGRNVPNSQRTLLHVQCLGYKYLLVCISKTILAILIENFVRKYARKFARTSVTERAILFFSNF